VSQQAASRNQGTRAATTPSTANASPNTTCCGPIPTGNVGIDRSSTPVSFSGARGSQSPPPPPPSPPPLSQPESAGLQSESPPPEMAVAPPSPGPP
jgi:hypothetical protein